MPPIYINTDNSDKNSKIYIANMAGPTSSEIEDKMQKLVVKAFEKEPDFTTNKVDKPKGYTLLFKVTKFSSSGREASCTITGEILEYGRTFSKDKRATNNGGTRSVMTAGQWSGSAAATGRTAAIDCVEAIMERMVPKSIPVMKADMASR